MYKQIYNENQANDIIFHLKKTSSGEGKNLGADVTNAGNGHFATDLTNVKYLFYIPCRPCARRQS
jgi:hypothetical protein